MYNPVKPPETKKSKNPKKNKKLKKHFLYWKVWIVFTFQAFPSKFLEFLVSSKIFFLCSESFFTFPCFQNLNRIFLIYSFFLQLEANKIPQLHYLNNVTYINKGESTKIYHF